MVAILVTKEHVSKLSAVFFWLNLLTTNLTLYLSMEPSGLNFVLKIHLLQIGLQPLGGSIDS